MGRVGEPFRRVLCAHSSRHALCVARYCSSRHRSRPTRGSDTVLGEGRRRRAIASKLAFVRQREASDRHDANQAVKYSAFDSYAHADAILLETKAQCMTRYCRVTAWIRTFQGPKLRCGCPASAVSTCPPLIGRAISQVVTRHLSCPKRSTLYAWFTLLPSSQPARSSASLRRATPDPPRPARPMG